MRRIRRTVKRSVNRSSCTCKRKVCFVRVVCTFSVLKGLPKIGKLQNATMYSFDTRNPGSLVKYEERKTNNMQQLDFYY